MKKINKLFLEALKASLNNARVNWTSEDVSPQEMEQIFRMADIHNIMPMIFEAVFTCEAIQKLPPEFVMRQKRSVMYNVAVQAMKTAEFQVISDRLRKEGIMPCVVKGIICRNLYPNPDARLSGDEDILIPDNQFKNAHDILIQSGMSLGNPDLDFDTSYEIPYVKNGSPLYIEAHRYMFPPESEAYGDLNRFFEGIHQRTIQTHSGQCGLIEDEINGTKFLTMNHTDHLLYLILHSFKHFLHSGFGIRQVCDINLYATAYGESIDWDYVSECLREVRADLFAVSMFIIGEKYLTFESDKACYPDGWKSIEIDETSMLEDLLESGVYGQAEMSRRHSSNITLNAIISDRRGEVVKTGGLRAAIKAVCLPLEKLSDRFTYLRKMPFLLPVAWIQRVWIYKKETAGKQVDNNAADSIRIGNERIDLMRKYGIIK